MGSNLGWASIDVEFFRPPGSEVYGPDREIFYARYIDWFVTTPLLLLDLLLTAGLPWPTIIWTIFLDWVMIITGLVGALTWTRYKFGKYSMFLEPYAAMVAEVAKGYYAFGCAAMFYVFYIIAIEGRKHAKRLGSDIERVYTICGILTLFIWLLYPIAWGLCEGGNVIPPDSEAAFYGALDFCAKPVFSVALIVGHWDIDPGRMGLKIRDYDEDPDYFGSKNRNSDHKVRAEGGEINVTGTENGMRQDNVSPTAEDAA